MKPARFAAIGAAVALIAGSALAGGIAANAADAPTTNYYTADQFVPEASPYPAQWFIGGGSADNALESTPTGLQMTGEAQILNGVTPTTGLGDLVAGASFNVASGDATFQVSLFAGPGSTNFTTLRPIGTNTLTGQWTLSRSVAGLTANQPYGLDEIVSALGESYTILAYGAFVDPGTTATIASITWNGVTSVFTPQPAPTPVDPAQPATPVKAPVSFTG